MYEPIEKLVRVEETSVVVNSVVIADYETVESATVVADLIKNAILSYNKDSESAE